MKMKRACEATALTERAIRLYLKNKLICPRLVDGIIDFSDEDIRQLKDIALLRQLDFTIEQIACMIHDPAVIQSVLLFRMDTAQADIEHDKDVYDALSRVSTGEIIGVHMLAAQIRESRIALPEPDFGRLDEMSDEERQQGKTAAYAGLLKRDRWEAGRNRWMIAFGVLAVLVVFAAIFLWSPRIQGYVGIAPFTVVEVDDRLDVVTIRINDRMADMLDRETITVPFHYFREHLIAGSTIERGCQLAIKLNNYDLISIGINPMQTFQTQSADVNRAWIKHILRTLFEDDTEGRATLWVYEPSGLKPFFE